MNNLRVKAQVSLIATIAILGFAVATSIYVISANTQEGFLHTQMVENSGVAYTNFVKQSFLQERRNEKYFLLRLDKNMWNATKKVRQMRKARSMS